MKTVFIIIGRSGSGKDTITNYICHKFGLKQLLSYANRPKRYDNENTHIFINFEECIKLKQKENIIAYTQIGKYEYFANEKQLEECDVYILDPNGVKYMQNVIKDENKFNFVFIYVYTPFLVRMYRLFKRSKNYRNLIRRCIDENTQFKKYEKEKNYHYIVNNLLMKKSKQMIENIIYSHLPKGYWLPTKIL